MIQYRGERQRPDSAAGSDGAHFADAVRRHALRPVGAIWCRATDKTGPLATLRTGPPSREGGSDNGRIGAACFAGGVAAEGGDADAGRGRGDAAADGAGVGRASERGELGCSHMTVRRYLAAGGWVAYRGRDRGHWR